MQLLLIVVFVGVFAVFALLLIASGTGASQRTKETLARLESTLAAGGKAHSSDEIVDLRKQELLSAVPWLNRWLLRLEVAPRLRFARGERSLDRAVQGIGRAGVVDCGMCEEIGRVADDRETDAFDEPLLSGTIRK